MAVVLHIVVSGFWHYEAC